MKSKKKRISFILSLFVLLTMLLPTNIYASEIVEPELSTIDDLLIEENDNANNESDPISPNDDIDNTSNNDNSELLDDIKTSKEEVIEESISNDEDVQKIQEIIKEESSQEEVKTYIFDNYVGQNIDDVKNLLKENNIEPIINYEYNNDYDEDVIINQSIEPNTPYNGENLTLIVSLGQEFTPEVELQNVKLVNTKQTNSFGLGLSNGDGTISIDGDFSDWDGLPKSYEYNWDNSENCWQWGVWINGQQYLTPRGTYDTNVRHLMQLYSDGEYIYLHVIIARDYGAKFNGEDYQFWIDGQMAAFQIEWPNGGTITGDIANKNPGIYPVEIRHRNSQYSYNVATGATGFLKINDDKVNTELEIRIPVSEMKLQNNNINIENLGTIEFFTPNLMYRRMVCAGSSSGPIIFGIITLSCFVGFLMYLRYKKQQIHEIGKII